MNGIYQPVITAYREKVNAKAFFSLDIGIGVGVLIQVAHHGKESGLISVKAAPRMKAHIRFSVLFPSRDSKENGRYSRCYFKVGEQLKFFRVGWLKILREILFNLYLHRCTFHNYSFFTISIAMRSNSYRIFFWLFQFRESHSSPLISSPAYNNCASGIW